MMEKIKNNSRITMWFLVLLAGSVSTVHAQESSSRPTYWDIQSIDTVKFSRDLAREKNKDMSFDAVIEAQTSQIAKTGATHIALGTPYDQEFLPFLRRWVVAARKNHLHVWFRGNWSGWEQWFGYQTITPKQHISQTVQFIKDNPDIFMDGDIFSSCPECENGGPGDPRHTGKVVEFRNFLIDLTRACESATAQINRKVSCNIHSMNADVADIVMDPETTQKLGGVVVVDHYVQSPTQLVADIKKIAIKSKGKVILGEFGAPIPDIHGTMTESQQAQWIHQALAEMLDTPELVGINYWTNIGGSSSLWSGHNIPRLAVREITRIYTPNEMVLHIKNRAGDKVISRANLKSRIFLSDKNGTIRLPKRADEATVPTLVVSANGYKDQGVSLGSSQTETDIQMEKISENLFFKLRSLLFQLSHSIISG